VIFAFQPKKMTV